MECSWNHQVLENENSTQKLFFLKKQVIPIEDVRITKATETHFFVQESSSTDRSENLWVELDSYAKKCASVASIEDDLYCSEKKQYQNGTPKDTIWSLLIN